MSTAATSTTYGLHADHVFHRIQRVALAVGVAGLALSALGAVISPEQFFHSYLIGYLFWFGIAMGCLAILMLHHVAGGAWGAVIRRLLESGTRTLPLMALLFLPLVGGIHQLYEWANAEHVAHDALLLHKSIYLNVPFFLARAAFYFAAWLTVAAFLNRWSLAQDRCGDRSMDRRIENLSRGGLLLFGLTMTFAAIDWVMSLEPHWASTIFGVIIMGGQVLTAMAFVIPMLALLADREPMSKIVSAEQFHDLGKLLLAFVMIWAYVNFSQFLIIWSANLPEEIPWYLKRLQGGWQYIAIGLILFHFILPFLVLLSRDLKKDARVLATVAIAVILIRFVDLVWLISPAFHPGHLSIHWLDITVALGIGGLWLSVFVWKLKAHPVLPLNDPSLPEERR